MLCFIFINIYQNRPLLLWWSIFIGPWHFTQLRLGSLKVGLRICHVQERCLNLIEFVISWANNGQVQGSSGRDCVDGFFNSFLLPLSSYIWNCGWLNGVVCKCKKAAAARAHCKSGGERTTHIEITFAFETTAFSHSSHELCSARGEGAKL